MSAAIAATAPVVEDTSPLTVGETSALLGAKINPGGASTTYHFEYGTADCSLNPCERVPAVDKNVGSGESPVAVSDEVTALQAGTTYYFRAVAVNGNGTTEGPVRTFTTFAPSPSQSCPNQAFRTGSSAALANCRAYEMVTPVEKNGGDIVSLCNSTCLRTAYYQASVDGGRITYSAYKSFGDAKGSFYSNQYLASRGADGWSNHGLNPAHEGSIYQEDASLFYTLENSFKDFTPDLSYGIFTDDANPPIEPDAVADHLNLFRFNVLADANETITTEAPTVAGGIGGTEEVNLKNIGYPEMIGISADGDHSIFQSHAAYPPLTTNKSMHIYDWSEGQLHLVSALLDNSENAQEAFINRGDRSHAISEDGSRIFWTMEVGGDKIFVRKDLTKTVAVSSPVAANAYFVAASFDGEKAFFIGEGDELWEFDTASATRNLIAAEVPEFLGASDDGSYVYFASREALDGGVAGEPNLYLAKEGTIRLIGTLDEADVSDGRDQPGLYNEWYVTPDGQKLVFVSLKSLTGYDNTDAISGEKDLEVFRYDAAGEDLTCVSCNPTGTRPHGSPLEVPWRVDHRLREDEAIDHYLWGSGWIAANTSKQEIDENPSFERYKPRVATDDGKMVFFNSFDALVKGDTNSQQDVYEWREEGVAGCGKPDGCVSLVSSGESPQVSTFFDASPDGTDVYFFTSSSLLPQDKGLVDIYDARIDGGYPQPVVLAGCEGEACQSLPAPPNDPTPASSNYNGPGNVQPPKPKKKHKKHKKHRKQQKKKKGSSKRAAHPATHRNG